MNMLESDEIAEEAAETIREGAANDSVGKTQPLLLEDPCMSKHCGAGRVCEVTIRLFLPFYLEYTNSTNLKLFK